MRLLLINPNISTSVTDRLATVARKAARPGTHVTALTAPRGVPYISNRAEAQIAGTVVLEMLAEYGPAHDGALIGAFGDPGLWAARELFDIPVVGLAEAAMHTAAMLGERFAIVTFAPALGSWYRDCVRDCGLTSRLAAIRSLTSAFNHIDDVAAQKADALADLCERTRSENGADVVILAGAPLAGLAVEIAHRVSVPLVEQVAAGVAQLEVIASLALPLVLGGRRPVAKPSHGLPVALAARIGHADG